MPERKPDDLPPKTEIPRIEGSCPPSPSHLPDLSPSGLQDVREAQEQEEREQEENEKLQLIANTIRILSAEGVEKAKSGHPGMPMGCAEILAVLFGKVLKRISKDDKWPNRDRFVLSAGHGSMGLYITLHLTGFIEKEQLLQFRQLGSLTPGHPEYRDKESEKTPGVDATTGMLGQGVGNAVGMALAERIIEKLFNAEENKILNHSVYCLAGDGDIMEGVTTETATLAGHMGLANLIMFYDSNDITIEGSTELTLSMDTKKVYEGFGWFVQEIDGHNISQIKQAILKAQSQKEKPSLIIAKTTIAKGAPTKQGKEISHGSPLGEEEIRRLKEKLQWKGEPFFIPPEVYAHFQERDTEMTQRYYEWLTLITTMGKETKKKWDSFFNKRGGKDIDIENLRSLLPSFDPSKKISTREASGRILEKLFKELIQMMGGSGDLAPSCKTLVKGQDKEGRDYGETGKGKVGRNIHFGIREHGMAAILNGISYYAPGAVPYGSTFLAVSDYMKPSMRIAALSNLPVVYILTHDSFFVGEDGVTHQPLEHLAMLRSIKNMTVIRPADAEETKEAWLAALQNTKGPTALILSRQELPVIQREENSNVEQLHKGAYIIWESLPRQQESKILLETHISNPVHEQPLDLIFVATGSEVSLALEATRRLEKSGIRCRVVSMPSWELFEQQPKEYQQRILPPGIKKVVVEAGERQGWDKYAGNDALFITMEEYGASAPAEVLAEKYGFTPDQVTEKVKGWLQPRDTAR